MKHRKEAHEEKVNQCSFFLKGNCVHGNQWWYSHKNDSKSVPEYRCRICETVFSVRFEFMQHHLETVPTCRDAFSGTCQFGRVKCWFNHDETDSSNANRNTENANNVNQEVLDKMFNMMENFTQRIMELENKI